MVREHDTRDGLLVHRYGAVPVCLPDAGPDSHRRHASHCSDDSDALTSAENAHHTVQQIDNIEQDAEGDAGIGKVGRAELPQAYPVDGSTTNLPGAWIAFVS
jgi:hypothetical protein